MEKNWEFKFPYRPDSQYSKPAAYFSMEFAIDQPLKIYSGGLGFLAGSHMRSAYELRQNIVGIGILWKRGYYDQVRKEDKSMAALFQEKIYSFLEDTGIKFQIEINRHPVTVKAYYLHPEVFGTAPMFLLSTDLPENDYLAQTTSHRLYDSNTATRIAQYILLGAGGARLMDIIGYEPEVYHLNEAHALPAAFHLYRKYGSLSQVREHFVFTTHTPEKAGNEEHNMEYLHQMGFFLDLKLGEVRKITGIKSTNFSLTLGALRMAKIANSVSKKHEEVTHEMWKDEKNICPVISITNAQNKRYWADERLWDALESNDSEKLIDRKKKLKQRFFKVVADQTGKLFDPDVLTIVWARRFAEYKRADLIIRLQDRFHEMMTNKDMPVQMIWAGKPYPSDYGAVGTFDNLVHLNKGYMTGAVLVGYELELSRYCKQGADIWLNNPRVPREASGTSGMTAAMNGAINLSTRDGWMLEYGKDKVNSFLLPLPDPSLPIHEQDNQDANSLMDLLQNEVIPMYYRQKNDWISIMKNSMHDVIENFESGRMADEYYRKLYYYQENTVEV